MLQYDKKKTGLPHLPPSTSRPTTAAGPLQDARTSSSSSFSSSSLSSSSSSSISSSSSSASASAPDRHNLHLQQQQQQQQQQQPQHQKQQTAVCAACRQIITDRYLLKAVDETWHEDCLRCSSCQCCLARIGSTLFTKDDMLLCRHDYLRLYGASGVCSSCAKMIPAFEMVMRAGDNVYHLDCFYCAECKSRFCVGDRYYLTDEQTILCEYDYHLYHHQRQNLHHQHHQQHDHHQHDHINHDQHQQQITSWLSSSQSTPASGHPSSSVAGHRGGASAGGAQGLALLPPIDDDGDLKPPSLSRRSSIDSPPLHDDASSGYGSPSPDTAPSTTTTTTTTTRGHHHHHGGP